jgi:hypothetical protein
MNLNLYGHAGKWLMVDLGIAFGDDSTPGVEVVMPDPAFIEERKQDLAGIILTHAHEDHLGAVADLWPRLEAPVYATPFAASVLKRKLREAGLFDAVPITEIALGGKFTVGPFELEMITMTHSIPEPNALAIRTKPRHGLPYRRLEDRSRAALGRGDRRGDACRGSASRVRSPWSATAPTCSSKARRARRRPSASTSRSW